MTLQVKVRYFTCRSRYPIAEGNTRSPWTLPETFVQSNILRAKNYEINKTILYTLEHKREIFFFESQCGCYCLLGFAYFIFVQSVTKINLLRIHLYEPNNNNKE